MTTSQKSWSKWSIISEKTLYKQQLFDLYAKSDLSACLKRLIIRKHKPKLSGDTPQRPLATSLDSPGATSPNSPTAEEYAFDDDDYHT